MPTASALIGHTGFVGSNLVRQHGFDAFYNSRNIEAIAGRRFGLLVFAGAQAKKWWANQNPAADLAGIERALAALQTVTAERTVLISTIDVIPPGAGVDETANCAAAPNHAYGRHRRLLEEAFAQRFRDLLIVRLPGLFGEGLKKNVIFDLLTDNELEKVNPASRFQYYDLGRLWQDIETAGAAGLDLVHLVTEPLGTDELIAALFPGKRVGTAPLPTAAYDFRTRHGHVFGGRDGYLEDRAAVLERLRRFVAARCAGSA